MKSKYTQETKNNKVLKLLRVKVGISTNKSEKNIWSKRPLVKILKYVRLIIRKVTHEIKNKKMKKRLWTAKF